MTSHNQEVLLLILVTMLLVVDKQIYKPLMSFVKQLNKIAKLDKFKCCKQSKETRQEI